ncbi:MAG: VOC family protein [Woeseiaceae bacterium]|nr:VOC family protein [Woeseiaceae bacterium]
MIGYITLGTNDIDRAAAFYDELFATIGAGRLMEGDNYIAWGRSMQEPGISVITPYDGKPATVGNGVMIAIAAGSTELVDAVHAKALELGGTDEGPPGERNGGFYAAYFRDLDGNKLNAFCMVGS